MRLPIVVLFAFGGLFGLTSCPKSQDSVPIPIRSASDLSGRLIFLDQFQKDSLDPATLTNISVTAASTSPVASYTAAFDIATRRYLFALLPPGKYAITYKADGLATIVNPSVEHGGGKAHVLPVAYVYKPSNTIARNISASNLVESAVTIYNLPVNLARNTVYTQKPEDTLYLPKFIRIIIRPRPNVPNRFDTIKTTVYDTVLTTATRPLSFNRDTSFLLRQRFVQITKRVVIRASIDSINQAINKDVKLRYKSRGVQIYFSDLPDAGPANFKFIATSDPLLTDSVFRMVFELDKFVAAGILRTDAANPNRTLYLSAYGKSGDNAWYGIKQDPANTSTLILPGLNLSPGSKASNTLQLELP